MKILPALMMKLQGITYGKNCVFKGIPIIAKSRSAVIQIGDKCRMNSGILANLVGMYQRTIVVARGNGFVKIGNNVGISGTTIYAREAITIGDNCLIGANTKIIDNDFHPVDPDIRLSTPNDNIASAPVKLGNNVFIGCNSLVLKGVTIGDNSVIGAGSVVVKNIPANSVAAGNPAKVIKQI